MTTNDADPPVWLITDAAERIEAESVLQDQLSGLRDDGIDRVDRARCLYWAVRLTVQLGRPDDALPLTRELMAIPFDLFGTRAHELPYQAYRYLQMIAWHLFHLGRWGEALALDLEANEWFATHRGVHEDSFIRSVAFVARDQAALGDFQAAVATLTATINERSGSTARAFSPNSRFLQSQRASHIREGRRNAKNSSRRRSDS